jgi:hypothetical protein
MSKSKEQVLKEMDKEINSSNDSGTAASEAAYCSRACAIGIRYLVEKSK